MIPGLVVLALSYGLSQFYRAFLPVLAPVLATDVGATAQDLATASGIWFLVFAAMQIPVGAALDRTGPRWTTAVLFAVGGAGGALAFAFAQTPLHIHLAMALLGIGCAPVLMACYFIFARQFPPALFATLATATIGLGSLGNIAGSAPLAAAVAAWGWRPTLLALAVVSLAVAGGIAVWVRDPARAGTTQPGSVLDVLRIRALWPLFAVMLVSYAPAAGVRGLWAGPYVADIFDADTATIGRVTLVMGLAMVAGSFAYGPLDRLLGTRKWVIFGGNVLGLVALIALALAPAGLGWATVLLAVVGFAASGYGMIIAHARAFIPAHLTGRGVTLMNLFGIGGAGLMQTVTGPISRLGTTPALSYTLVFGSFALVLALGTLAYLAAQDRTD
ncbi:Predicted arabinose efflux permease, MFS family [Loktanella fryxellensis]|uniref:Predicted arabinose efflux permease, MFS family n=1 Tax=Loktanella fryxellensis TaxID=245187 RepID=A0A1H8FKI1_9RHOB|nr:MFS transporter [Loktanella fryxellensis]SEN32090.1 Predicted arabinose efflux permease, MFS family [Loktanella fryxellensis]